MGEREKMGGVAERCGGKKDCGLDIMYERRIKKKKDLDKAHPSVTLPPVDPKSSCRQNIHTHKII